MVVNVSCHSLLVTSFWTDWSWKVWWNRNFSSKRSQLHVAWIVKLLLFELNRPGWRHTGGLSAHRNKKKPCTPDNTETHTPHSLHQSFTALPVRKMLVVVMVMVREQRIIFGFAPDQYYTHLLPACLKFNLLRKIEVFYLQVDNALHRNSILRFVSVSYHTVVTWPSRPEKLLQLLSAPWGAASECSESPVQMRPGQQLTLQLRNNKSPRVPDHSYVHSFTAPYIPFW